MRSFVSDNFSAVHPAVLEYLTSISHGHSVSYGGDEITAEANRHMAQQFSKTPIACYYVTNGSAANALAIKSMLSNPYECVLTPATSHLVVQEGGALAAQLGV